MASRLVAGVRGSPALLCLAVAVVVSAVILLRLQTNLTFVTDDWELLVNRPGSSIGVFLDPYHEHIVIATAVVYKLLLATFGMDSALPFYVVSTFAFLLSGVLLFVYLRPRIGDWPALLAALLILFLGDAFEDLLWPFQIGYFGSVAAGLGMLIALDRDDKQGDLYACGLLAVSMSFSSVGLIFAVGALVDLALSRRPRAERAYVALLPLALYALWWLGWGHNADSHLSLHNLANMPEYFINAAAAGITGLLGLATGDGSEPDQPGLVWGQILLVAGIALGAFRLSRGGRVSRDLVIVLAIGLTFWVLAGLNSDPGRAPTSSRYIYPSAIFLLLIMGEALRGRRFGRASIVAAGAVTVAAIMGGLSLLHTEYRERWRPASDYLRASLAAVEIGRDSVVPTFVVSFAQSVNTSPEIYLAAVDDYGSPAFSESELVTKAEDYRAAADGTLASALGLSLAAPSGQEAGGCQTVQASPGGFTDLTLSPGEFTLTNEAGADIQVLLGRFSDGLPVDLGPLLAGSGASLTIPADRSIQPWRLGLVGEGPVNVC
ncbi:MAG: hypothetical protein AABM29_03410 [Actinomycetota bacterium]